MVRGVEQAESGADERALVLRVDRPVGCLACHREEVGLELVQSDEVELKAAHVRHIQKQCSLSQNT